MSARPEDVIAGVLTIPGGGLLAKAILAALHAAGLVVVPREPTEAMILAAPSRDQQATEESMYHGIYRAMIAAAIRALD